MKQVQQGSNDYIKEGLKQASQHAKGDPKSYIILKRELVDSSTFQQILISHRHNLNEVIEIEI